MDRNQLIQRNTIIIMVVIIYRLLLTMLYSFTERQFWVHPINESREEKGAYDSLVEELRHYPVKFEEFLRMKPETFDFLLSLVRPRIEKMDTPMRKAIKPEIRLAVTLWFLATGLEYKHAHKIWRIGASTAAKIVNETCRALWEVLSPTYMKAPQTDSDWKEIAEGFYQEWNFPHCIGAVDGKHCFINKPANAGSEFFSHKGSHSLILMAVADAYYKFVYIDVGKRGSEHDGGVWEACSLGKMFENGTIRLPESEELPDSERGAGYFLVGDDAFPLKTYLLKPFPGRELSLEDRVYNYRLSRARRVVENAFGILSQRWRLLLRPMQGNMQNIKMMVAAMCCLHNFLLTIKDVHYTPPGFTDEINGTAAGTLGHWRIEGDLLPQGPRTLARHAAHAARSFRETLRNYFSNEGAVGWQVYEVEKRK